MGQSDSVLPELTARITHLSDRNSVPSNRSRRFRQTKSGKKFPLPKASKTCIEPAKTYKPSEHFSYPREGQFSTLEVDHEGIEFELAGTGLTVFAPPGVVPRGEKRSIFVGVSWEEAGDSFINWKDDCAPGSTTCGRTVSPVVVCLFVGALEKPLCLRFPHCVANGSFLRGLVVVQNFERWCVVQGLGTDVWTKAAISNEISTWDFENQTSAIVYQDRCLFFTRTPVTVACACTNHNDFRIALNMCVLVYHDKLSDDNDVRLRVYVADNNADNLMCIEQQETKAGGTKCHEDADFTFAENELDLKIRLVDVDSGWECSEPCQTVDYFSLWLGSRTQCRTFTFEGQGTPEELKCTFAVFQGKPQNGTSVNISVAKRHLIHESKNAELLNPPQPCAEKVVVEVNNETRLLQERKYCPDVPSPKPSPKPTRVKTHSKIMRRLRRTSSYSDGATIEMMMFM